MFDPISAIVNGVTSVIGFLSGAPQAAAQAEKDKLKAAETILIAQREQSQANVKLLNTAVVSVGGLLVLAGGVYLIARGAK